MNIQCFSDLHFDINHDCETFFDKKLFLEQHAILPDTDVIVIAGDTHNDGYNTVDWIHDVLSKHLLPHQHIVYIFGNHEFYDRDMKSCYQYAITREGNPQVKFLHEDTSIVINDVLFVGDVLWTDLNYNDNEFTNAMMLRNYMNDYKCIVAEKKSQRFITPNDTKEIHLRQLPKIIDTCKQHKGKIVIVTHHSPTLLSVHERYIGKPFNCGYVSDIICKKWDPVFENVALWIHGHVHDSVDVDCMGVRVVANPFGYMKWYGGHLENDNFRFSNKYEI